MSDRPETTGPMPLQEGAFDYAKDLADEFAAAGRGIPACFVRQQQEAIEDLEEAARAVICDWMCGEPMEADLGRLKQLLGMEDSPI